MTRPNFCLRKRAKPPLSDMFLNLQRECQHEDKVMVCKYSPFIPQNTSIINEDRNSPKGIHRALDNSSPVGD